MPTILATLDAMLADRDDGMQFNIKRRALPESAATDANLPAESRQEPAESHLDVLPDVQRELDVPRGD